MARGRQGGPRERAHLLDRSELGGLPAAAAWRRRASAEDGATGVGRTRGRADEDAEARRARRRAAIARGA